MEQETVRTMDLQVITMFAATAAIIGATVGWRHGPFEALAGALAGAVAGALAGEAVMGGLLYVVRRMCEVKLASPGDLIEISREPGIPYQHWAVYVGDGYVVHLVKTPDPPSIAKIEKEKLKVVVGKDKWRVNNNQKELTPRPAQIIVKDALSMVGQDMGYHVIWSNCEHFSKWLRYGKGNSAQVEKGAERGGVVVVVGGFLGGFFGLAAGPAWAVVAAAGATLAAGAAVAAGVAGVAGATGATGAFMNDWNDVKDFCRSVPSFCNC